MAVLAAASLAVAVQPWVGWSLAVGAGLALMLCALALAPKSPFHSVAVDAGGNWALADERGWHEFSVRRIWTSPLGWLTLAGRLSSPEGRGAPARLTLWADSVPPADWRALRIAAAWTRQRGEGLLVPASARDPRRRVSA
jgi:hypothetical protein